MAIKTSPGRIVERFWEIKVRILREFYPTGRMQISLHEGKRENTWRILIKTYADFCQVMEVAQKLIQEHLSEEWGIIMAIEICTFTNQEALR